MHYEQYQDGSVKCVEDEAQFELPNGWMWSRITGIADIIMGSSPKGVTIKNSGDGMEFHQGKIAFTNKVIADSGKVTTAQAKIAPPNSVLLCVRAPVGEANITDRKVCIGRGLAAITPIGELSIDFLFYWLRTYKEYLNMRATGSTFVAITADTLKRILLPIPPVSEQKRIEVTIREILDFIEKIESDKEIIKSNLEKAKSKILDLAIRGKLVPQDPNDEPASVLLERIKAEKEELIKQGKIKRDKKESVIFKGDDNSYYHHIDNGSYVCDVKIDLPTNWIPCTITDVSYLVGTKENQIKTNEIKKKGKYPVISQSQIIIDGYCDFDSKVIENVPAILFGDHTKVVKYIDQPFVIGADGTKIHKIIFADEKFIYYWMQCVSSRIESKGYSRHYNLLKKSCLLLPPLSEQKRIVEAIETILTQLDDISYTAI